MHESKSTGGKKIQPRLDPHGQINPGEFCPPQPRPHTSTPEEAWCTRLPFFDVGAGLVQGRRRLGALAAGVVQGRGLLAAMRAEEAGRAEDARGLPGWLRAWSKAGGGLVHSLPGWVLAGGSPEKKYGCPKKKYSNPEKKEKKEQRKKRRKKEQRKKRRKRRTTAAKENNLTFHTGGNCCPVTVTQSDPGHYIHSNPTGGLALTDAAAIHSR
ncbi:hypothetical protein ACLB2K_043151 [Fragaria x ananassa]